MNDPLLSVMVGAAAMVVAVALPVLLIFWMVSLLRLPATVARIDANVRSVLARLEAGERPPGERTEQEDVEAKQAEIRNLVDALQQQRFRRSTPKHEDQ